MPVANKASINLAIKNIANYGDTDIFPFCIDNRIFHDNQEDVFAILEKIDNEFNDYLEKIPLLVSKNISAVGYSGFRWGSQIDPIWNAYLLALVIQIGKDIEHARVGEDYVFSYRFRPNKETGSLFNKEIGWQEFQKKSVSECANFEYVLRCDISDFYPRIYHHRLENALKSATGNQSAVSRIMKILSIISDGVSYGLPVGGPASRLLSEILMNRMDRLIRLESIKYCRFVDDFIVFSNTKEDAYSSLIKINQLLLKNEGLSLQKSKTRIMSKHEFLSTSEFSEDSQDDPNAHKDENSFRKLKIHFDPYSTTAEADYNELKIELSSFDISGMLARQILKSRIDESFTKRLISAIKHLPEAKRNSSILTVISNLEHLYPIYPSVMILLKDTINDVDEPTQQVIFETLRKSIQENSYLVQIPNNLAYALRVLYRDNSIETEVILVEIYRKTDSIMLKRDIILMMAYRRADHWISDTRKSFPSLNSWEKRSILMSSYTLGDEGKHWRDSIKNKINDYDELLLKWAEKIQGNGQKKFWEIPL